MGPSVPSCPKQRAKASQHQRCNTAASAPHSFVQHVGGTENSPETHWERPFCQASSRMSRVGNSMHGFVEMSRNRNPPAMVHPRLIPLIWWILMGYGSQFGWYWVEFESPHVTCCILLPWIKVRSAPWYLPVASLGNAQELPVFIGSKGSSNACGENLRAWWAPGRNTESEAWL